MRAAALRRYPSDAEDRTKRLTAQGPSEKLHRRHDLKEDDTVIRVIRVCLVATAILITILEFFGIRDFFRSPYTGLSHQSLVIREVDESGPNANLPIETGDKILAVDGEIVRNVNHFKYLVYSNTEFETQVYTLARGDSLFQASVACAPQPTDKTNKRFTLMVVGFTFILVGFIVVLRRPDILGLLFTANFNIFSFLLTVRPVTSSSLLHITGELAYDLLFIFLPALFLHFSLLYPGRTISVGTRRSRLIRLLYIPPAVIFVMTFVLALSSYSGSDVHAAVGIIEALITIYWALYIILVLVAFIRTYVVSDKAQRVKFRIVVVYRECVG